MRDVEGGSGQRRTLSRNCVVAIAIVSGSACHTFTPVNVDVLRAAQQVRMHLLPAAIDEAELALGRQTSVFLATVEYVDPSDLVVRVSERDGHGPVVHMSQRLVVSRDELGYVELRTLNRTRTAITIGSAIAATTVFLVRLFGNQTGDERSPSGGSPDLSFVR